MAGKFCNRVRFFFVAPRTILIPVVLSVALCGQDLSQQGAAAMRAGRYAEAERIYRQLLKQQPGQAGWEANLGLALHSQGEYTQASEHLERSLKLMPNQGLSAVLGIDYLKLGQPCKAIAALEKTDKQEALADALSGCKRYGEAARLYEQLGSRRLAAQSWWQARSYARARVIFDSVADEYAADPGFCYEYGDTLLRAESPETAIPWLQRATSLVEARAALGKALSAMDRYAEAIPHLEAALTTDPDLLLPLSRAYKATGRAAEAERALKEYRKRQVQN